MSKKLIGFLAVVAALFFVAGTAVAEDNIVPISGTIEFTESEVVGSAPIGDCDLLAMKGAGVVAGDLGGKFVDFELGLLCGVLVPKHVAWILCDPCTFLGREGTVLVGTSATGNVITGATGVFKVLYADGQLKRLACEGTFQMGFVEPGKLEGECDTSGLPPLPGIK